MSTYNGEKYLAEQIDSILAQEGVHVELFIRDDGSTDSTRNILTEYANHNNNIHLNFGSNIGYVKSFLSELNDAPECNYYAFSDQDDYWLPKKLISAVKAIKQQEAVSGRNLPVVYYSNLYVTNSQLKVTRKTRLEARIKTYESIVLRKSIAGCTMVINTAQRQLLKPISDTVGAHDVLIYSLAYFADGIIICDSEAYIYYRQHIGNTIGTPLSMFSRIKREYMKFVHGNGFEARRAKFFLSIYREEFDPAIRKILNVVAGYRENLSYRLTIVFSSNFRTGDWRLTLLGKVKALFGLL